MKRIREWLLALMGLLLFVGCGKDVEFCTSVVIKAYTSVKSNEKMPLNNILLYGYAADTALYAPQSYNDALEGILTNKRDPEKQLKAERVGTNCLIDGHGASQQVDASGISSLYVLVVDPTNRLYGYTQLALVENLPHLYLSVTFELNKTESRYKSGNWMIFNEFFSPDITCTVRSNTQIIEGGSLSTLKGSKLFVFAVDEPEMWHAASLEEAEVGRLRHRSDNSIRDFDYSASSNASGDAKLTLPPRTYLLLLFNRSQRGYGLRPLTYKELCGEDAEIPAFPEYPVRPLSEGYQGEPQNKNLSICFASWQSVSPYEDENGWTIYIYAPEKEAEQPEEPDTEA